MVKLGPKALSATRCLVFILKDPDIKHVKEDLILSEIKKLVFITGNTFTKGRRLKFLFLRQLREN